MQRSQARRAALDLLDQAPASPSTTTRARPADPRRLAITTRIFVLRELGERPVVRPSFGLTVGPGAEGHGAGHTGAEVLTIIPRPLPQRGAAPTAAWTPRGKYDNGAARAVQDIARDAAKQDAAHGTVRARAEHQQVQPAADLDEHRCGVAHSSLVWASTRRRPVAHIASTCWRTPGCKSVPPGDADRARE